jgi:hypothetical protein
VAGDGTAADIQALGRALNKRDADYKKGYRTLQNFLSKTGYFVVKGSDVSRK